MTSHAGGRAFAGRASSRDCNCASLCLLLIVGQVTYVSFSSSLFQSVPCTPPNVDTRMRRSSNMKNRRTDRQTDGDSDRLMVDGATSFFTSIGCVVVVATCRHRPTQSRVHLLTLGRAVEPSRLHGARPSLCAVSVSLGLSGFCPAQSLCTHRYAIIFLNLGKSSRGGRQKLILEIIALVVNHPSGSHQQSSRAAG